MKPVVTVVGLFFGLALIQAENFPATSGSLDNSPSQKNISPKLMTQKLDHFNFSDDRTFQMAYMVNDEYYKSGGPIWIHLYGAQPITPWKNDHDLIKDLAREYNAMLLYPEHRYYGSTRPTRFQRFEDLQYLTVNQTLADLAHFIRYIRENDAKLESSKIIISGTFYGSSLAIWFHKYYPDLVDLTYAYGAPATAKLDFKEYKKFMEDRYTKDNFTQCLGRIRSGIVQLETMFAGYRSEEAARILNLCKSFNYTDTLNLRTLFYSISNALDYTTHADISEQCADLMPYRNNATAIAKFYIKKMLNGKSCIDISYSKFMQPYQDYHYKHGSERSWLYQQCNGFGWFPTSSDKDQIYGSSLQFFTKMCQDAFDKKYTKQYMEELVAETNNYLGIKIPPSKNFFISYGELDPWYHVQVKSEIYYINGGDQFTGTESLSDSDSIIISQFKQDLSSHVSWLFN